MPNYLRKSTNFKIEAKKILILVCSAQTRTRIGLLEKTPSSEPIPCRRKPLRRTRLLRDPAQTQVWGECAAKANLSPDVTPP
jgi:hypothetical protein